MTTPIQKGKGRKAAEPSGKGRYNGNIARRRYVSSRGTKPNGNAHTQAQATFWDFPAVCSRSCGCTGRWSSAPPGGVQKACLCSLEEVRPIRNNTRESSNEGRVCQGPQCSGVPWITPEDPWAKRRKVNDQRARDKLEKSLTRKWRSAQRRGKAKARGTIGGKRTLGRSGKGKQSIRDDPFLG